MSRDPLNQTRYRTLRAALILLALMAGLSAVSMLHVPRVHATEIALVLVTALASLALLPIARRVALSGDRVVEGRIGAGVIALGGALLMERILVSTYGSMLDNPAIDAFRLHFACAPLLYMAAVAVLPARQALRLSWLLWGVIVLVTLPGLYLKTGLDPLRPGVFPLLIWLLLANPLFILLLHALPHYEEQLDRTAAQIEHLRERAQLSEQLGQTERRFRLVVDSLAVGVWDRWVGPPEKRWWSPRMYELLGYAADELAPTEDNLRALLHPEDRDRVWKEGIRQLRAGDVMDVEFRLETKTRGYRWFNSHAKAERDERGRIVRLAGSLTDIHEQRLAEAALRGAQAELTRLAYRDTLTSLYNRRYFDEHFQREWERARRNRQPLALMLIDLDHFKAYNDRYGHPAGDTCLAQVARLLSRCSSRPADIVARLGGEEFGVVLPETHAAGAEEVALRMQSLLRAAAIPHEASPARVVTLSTGIAAIEGPEGPGPAELFEQADQALYEVKRRGRNGILRYTAEIGTLAQERQAGATPDPEPAYSGSKPR